MREELWQLANRDGITGAIPTENGLLCQVYDSVDENPVVEWAKYATGYTIKEFELASNCTGYKIIEPSPRR